MHRHLVRGPAPRVAAPARPAKVVQLEARRKARLEAARGSSGSPRGRPRDTTRTSRARGAARLHADVAELGIRTGLRNRRPRP